ncbi:MULTISPECIES: hypothetical protein [unclassified Microcoleus]|uniref:hypothetical protein n=1 Tax=unclassified Microcoleus TaxID=2642155 RepID=UPI002600871D|nr:MULTISPECIES: hypothetical protein [unclassified Microcoleus]
MKIINKVDPRNIEDLRSWCRARIADSEIDRSNYVDGRLNLWLFHKVDFRNGKVSNGYKDDRIARFCQKVYPGCDIGLLSFHFDHGNLTSNGLIKPHRDHSYGQPTARGVNLGSCVFDCNGLQYNLGDGDITEFNCKQIHGVSEILSPERFSITLWKFNRSKGYFPLP